ncbi:TnsA endonuclease N-terminal domain-containing protein [Malaciobacter mytili]|uniref:TnsA endonuclease N-terminal domain-containing protein n=1 Tax=Malaciobacter mytili TaxID=603050 RepID=UPI003BAF7EC2
MKEKLNFNKPARNIPTNYRNVTGRIFSNKSNRLVGYESKLERDFIYLFEFDDRVEKFLEQPITINYQLDGENRRYTPDFFILLKNGEEYLIEIKYKSDLYEKFDDLKYKFKVAIQYSNLNNCKFKIMTNKCSYMNNTNYMFNVHFLLSYNTINYDTYQLIKSRINKCNSIEELLNELSEDKYKQLDYINYIWTLVRHQIIKLNLQRKINNKSEILEFKNYDKEEFQIYVLDYYKKDKI